MPTDPRPYGMCAYPGHQPAPIWRPPVEPSPDDLDRITAAYEAATRRPRTIHLGPGATITRRRLYAWRTDRPPTPERAAAGCPNTGWIHEGNPPWRVIVAKHPDTLQTLTIGDVTEYTGHERTVDFDEWLPPEVRRRRPWWKRIIRVPSTQRKAD